MFSLNIGKIAFMTVTVMTVSCLGVPQGRAASPDKGAKVTYTASGTFTASPVNGNDTLKLSGQPFTITVVGSSAMKPGKHGRNWAIFKPLTMTGTVYSGLIPGQSIPIQASNAQLQQTVGASQDIFECSFPVTVVGIDLNVTAKIELPGGTLTNALIRPFASVALDSSNATVTYSNTTASTTLGVDSGTVAATAPSGNERAFVAAPSPLMLMASAQAVLPRGLPAIWQ